MISIIAAMDSKRGIGKDNKIPWHIREDLIHLKKLTKDHVVILGRKTYESMVWYYDRSQRPMPGRLYIIVTREKNYKPTRENAIVTNSLEEALQKAKGEDVFINGGAQIFKEAIEKNLVDKLYLTIVDGNFSCDTFFPDYSDFTKEKFIGAGAQAENGIRYKFVELSK